ncbi:MAG: hypothetical protein IJ461_10435 [Clostridia bacterium]|nr:hypothetical protein [Clostridia bacterium]
MTISSKTTVCCQKCGELFEADTYTSIDADNSGAQIEQFISGDYFLAQCPKCHSQVPLTYDFVYTDEKHRAMIWVVDKNSPDYDAKVNEITATAQRLSSSAGLFSYKTMRIVHSVSEFIEKVTCLERGRDDRIIEICKALVARQSLFENPTFDFDYVIYSCNTGKETISLLDVSDIEKEQFYCDLPDHAYRHFYDLYYSLHSKGEDAGQVQLIDDHWGALELAALLRIEVSRQENESATEATAQQDCADTDSLIVCPKCYSVFPGDSVFCQKCGSRLVSGSHAQANANVRDEKLDKFDRIKSEYARAYEARTIETAKANGHNRKLKRVLILVVAALAILLIVKDINDRAYYDQPRNMATDEMHERYTNVYVDVVHVEPVYFVYRRETTSRGIPIGDEYLHEVICRCQTVEGKIIWASIFYQRYPGGNYSQYEASYKTLAYSPSAPLRITGMIDLPEQVCDGLESEIGKVFVLDALSVTQ